MIHVEPAQEPETFDRRVRRPGAIAVAEMVGKTPPWPRTGGRRFEQRRRLVRAPDGSTTSQPVTHEADLPSNQLPSYWTRALDDLMRAYQCICAYSCFRIHEVTGARSVDHMAPRSRSWDRVYEWTNYRLACSLMNSRKRDFGDVLDPFEVRTGWFVLELVGFQVCAAKGLDSGIRAKVGDTIDRLGINEHQLRTRRERDATQYWEGEVSLRVLEEESPFVTAELRRQNRLRPEDV